MAMDDASFGVGLTGASVFNMQASVPIASAGNCMASSTNSAGVASTTAWFSVAGCHSALNGASGCWQPAKTMWEHNRINARGFGSNRDISLAFRILKQFG